MTEGRNFKTFLKESYAQLLWTVVTYLLKNIEHGIEIEIVSAYADCKN